MAITRSEEMTFQDASAVLEAQGGTLVRTGANAYVVETHVPGLPVVQDEIVESILSVIEKVDGYTDARDVKWELALNLMAPGIHCRDCHSPLGPATLLVIDKRQWAFCRCSGEKTGHPCAKILFATLTPLGVEVDA